MQLVQSPIFEIPGVTRGMPQRELFLFPGTEIAGLPRGALISISGAHGAGKTELVLRFLAHNPGVNVAWMEESFSLYPCAFPQYGVGLERVLFVESPEQESLWVLHQILKSQVFGVVVVSVSQEAMTDLVSLRRLQIVAEKNVCSVIFLSEQPLPVSAWPVSVQLQVSRDTASGEPFISVTKYKH